MILTIHKEDFAVDQDGQWRHKENGEWVAIDTPEWAETKEKLAIEETKMQIPEGHQTEMVVVYRTVTKTVPDYEAEVLCRHGWQRDTTELSSE